MSALERLKARRAAGSCAATACNTAATAHRAADAYLAAFDGPVKLQAPPALNCSSGGTLEYAAVARPAAAPASPSAACAPPGSWSATPSAWRQPPAAAPTAISLSDRNILCGSVDWAGQEAVLGTADHALYAVDLRRGRRRRARTLYTKAAGHSEWVAAVCHLPGGRVASGGLDSRIWLWPAAGTAPTAGNCSVLEGHAGSIAALAPIPGAPNRLLSATYDKQMICWDCSGRGRQLRVLSGHGAPVLQLAAAGSLAASGDRDGCLARWDVAAGQSLGALVQAHAGHCTALEWWGNGGASGGDAPGSSRPDARLLLSGGQDGAVCLWDARTGQQQAAMAAHASTRGRGAVGSIACMGDLVVTCGADSTVRALEARSGLQPAWQPAQLPDFPYCSTSCGGMLLVGCGDGSILAVDAASGRLCWSVRAAGSAVRTLAASKDLLVAGCDDGSAVLFDAAQPGG